MTELIFMVILRDDGVSDGDYIEQLTYVLTSRWRTSEPSRRDQWAARTRSPGVIFPVICTNLLHQSA